MPCPVACPSCGADGTHPANQFIRSALGATPAAPVPVPPPPTTAPGLRINRPPPPPAPPLGAPAAPVPPAPGPYIPAFARDDLPPTPRAEPTATIPRGILGGAIAGAVGMAGWYFLTMASEHEYGIAAWFVGILTGMGVRAMARDSSPPLGYIAAVCAIVAILGGEFLVVNSTMNRLTGMFKNVSAEAYDGMVEDAKQGVKLKTDDEIKSWLQTNTDDDDGAKVTVTAQDITDFRNTRQPKMQDLLNGKPSKDEFLKENEIHGVSLGTKFEVYKKSLTLFTLLWVIFGVASAWRIATR